KVFQGNSGPENPGTRSDNRIAVNAHVVKTEQLDDRIFTSGTLLANDEVELRSELTGKAIKIYFEEGSRVAAGQLLVKINDAELQAQLQREKYRQELGMQREERQRQLLKGNLVSQETYDVALNELNTIKAGIELINAQIEKTEIRAPFAGQIGLKYVSDGSYITPSTRIATLQSTNPVKVDFSIPEKYAGEIRRGAKVTFGIQGLKSTYQGTVYAIEPRIDQVTRTVQIRATSPNPNGELIPGAFAEVELVLRTIPAALTLPAQALIPELSGHKIFLYRGGVVESRAIEIGIRTSSTVQITKGVQPGDTVLTSGILQVRPGSPVNIVQFE
ncbi:MAG TPA: efflux RND transporter periplasmic adaptor subunit, partial [Bacteroidota bacterium]|nr:efflux RND transporter periplasmic adaptor subunit [Bacteroidota bacterium]